MGLWDTPLANWRAAGSAITSLGTLLGLPEMNIGENLFGVTGSFGQSLVPKAYAAEPTSPQPGSTGPTGYPIPGTFSSTSSGGGGSSGPSSPPAGVDLSNPVKKTDFAKSAGFNSWEEYQNAVNAAKSSAGDSNAAYQAKVRAGIESAYQPIFAELDRQAGMLPEQKKAFEDQIGSLSTQQAADVTAGEASQKTALEANKPVEENRAKEGFRTLEQDVRNILSATGNYLGSRGAADSSAPGAASEIITRGALQAKGKIISTKNEALSAIDAKIADVTSLAEDQTRKIDEWKSNKLYDIGQWAVTRLNELGTQKASAGAEQGKAIAQMIADTEKSFMDQLTKLDDSVLQYRTSITQWQTQRAADLEDYKTKLGVAAQYSSTTPTQYKAIVDAYGNVYRFNPETGQSEKVVDVTGQLSPGTTGKTKKPEDAVTTLGSSLGMTPTTTVQ